MYSVFEIPNYIYTVGVYLKIHAVRELGKNKRTHTGIALFEEGTLPR